ncbi:MAG: nitrite transporter NirC [Psychromonas sp.]
MYQDSISKCSANAARIVKLAKQEKLGFWISGAMAGAYVGLGIILIFTLGNLVDPAIRPLVMGSFFGIALTLVIIAGSELFTGHSMFLAFGALTKEITWADKFKVLPQTWAANLLGSIFVAYLFYLAGGGKLLNVEDSLLHNVALAKTQAPALILFAKGVLCNWLVCLAIWMCVRIEGTGRFIAIWWCLAAFIACGYEHSVANMTIFALSWFGDASEAYNLAGIGYNLLWVSLGNVVSGAVFMAAGYWFSTPKADRPELSGRNAAKVAGDKTAQLSAKAI